MADVSFCRVTGIDWLVLPRFTTLLDLFHFQGLRSERCARTVLSCVSVGASLVETMLPQKDPRSTTPTDQSSKSKWPGIEATSAATATDVLSGLSFGETGLKGKPPTAALDSRPLTLVVLEITITA